MVRGEGHGVFSVFDEARGIEDNQVIQKAYDENWILITNDKDFGEKVYRERRGIVTASPEDSSTYLANLLREHL